MFEHLFSAMPRNSSFKFCLPFSFASSWVYSHNFEFIKIYFYLFLWSFLFLFLLFSLRKLPSSHLACLVRERDTRWRSTNAVNTKKNVEWKIFDNQLLRCGQCNFSFSASEFFLEWIAYDACWGQKRSFHCEFSGEDYHLRVSKTDNHERRMNEIATCLSKWQRRIEIWDFFETKWKVTILVNWWLLFEGRNQNYLGWHGKALIIEIIFYKKI